MKHTHTASRTTYRVEVLNGRTWESTYKQFHDKKMAILEANRMIDYTEFKEVRVLEVSADKSGKNRFTIVWTPADEIPFLTADLEPTERQLKAEDAQAWAEFYA
jgi:hypothetical protein